MKGISVSGTGEISGAPDTLSIDLGVSVLKPTVQEATAHAASAANSLIDSLGANGVEDKAISTTNYSIRPEHEYQNDKQRLVGYRVMNSVRAKISDIERSGTIIDEATKAAGDNATVNGISFSIEDDAAMVSAAREAAWNDALGKAQQLASLSGRALGQTKSIVETVSRPGPPVELARMKAAEMSTTPIALGSASVSITLQVVFEFAT